MVYRQTCREDTQPTNNATAARPTRFPATAPSCHDYTMNDIANHSLRSFARGRKPFRTILADPPWRYEHPISLSRDIEEKYPTLPLEEICAVPVAQIATESALLFLWVPPPILEQAFHVITAWGFEYRTAVVWVKHAIGMGNYVRQKHSIC